MQPDLLEIFEAEFSKPPSQIEELAAREALGAEYPAGLHTYSWVSRTELRDAAARVAPGDRLVDLGCGRGGPGLWIAGVSGASLIGVDIAESGLAQAWQLADELGVPGTEFRVGSFGDSGLHSASADAVVTFDAFLFEPDKAAGFVELARILRPGGSLTMISWDYHTQPQNRPPQVPDDRPLAQAAGLVVESYSETVNWRERCFAYADYLRAHADDLAAEGPESVEQIRAGIDEMRSTMECMERRFELVARKPD